MKQLLEAGVHFGHRTKRWNPKMRPYIYGERKGIYIVDLQKTLKLLEEAYNFVRNQATEGSQFLFVGTKRQAQQIVEEECKRCGAFYVNNRWLGGLLTNFTTIKHRIKRLKELEEMEESGKLNALSKKEQSRVNQQLEKLRKNLYGVKDMEGIPDVVFVVDPKKEEIAVFEANKLGIPVIGIADTNCDPDYLDYIIPGNDDAIRAIQLIVKTFADAILEGREGFATRVAAEKKAEEEAVAKAEEAAARVQEESAGAKPEEATSEKLKEPEKQEVKAEEASKPKTKQVTADKQEEPKEEAKVGKTKTKESAEVEPEKTVRETKDKPVEDKAKAEESKAAEADKKKAAASVEEVDEPEVEIQEAVEGPEVKESGSEEEIDAEQEEEKRLPDRARPKKTY